MGQNHSSENFEKPSMNKIVSKNQNIPGKEYESPPVHYNVKAKYKYESMSEKDISFEINEIMLVVKEIDEYWLEVSKPKSQIRGLIPSSYVRKQDGSEKSLDGWHDIQRWEAEKLLMKMGLKIGTYIIRPSRKENSFALSVRDLCKDSKIFMVKHFQIKISRYNGKTIYSHNNETFGNILSMIKFFKKTGIGNSRIRLKCPFPDNYQPPIHFQDIEIHRDNLEFLNEIGHGCFGSVYRARWGRACEVAVKVMKSTNSERDIFLQEAKIMHKLRHRKIVELLGICSEPQEMPMILILEFMKNGSLRHYLKSDKGRLLDLSAMIRMMADISEGMSYLEGKNVVHRDLRADNILVDLDLTVKVADFGLTEFKDDKKEIKTTRFPFKWTAPEAAKSKVFTSKSDIWSFGVVMYEIVTWGKIPYPDILATMVIDILLTGYRMPNPQTIYEDIRCPNVIYQIMLECWNANPEKRPSFSCLLDGFDSIIVKDNLNVELNSFNK